MSSKKIDFSDAAVREAYRHTSSHIMAQAIKTIWPEAKLAIGPAIENGFYYDIDLEHKFTEDDLRKIEKEMKKIIKAGYPLERFELTREEAIKFMQDRNEDYKIELIKDLPDGEIISFYKQGDFVDLCAGPHMEKTSNIKAVKLTSVAGAYWRGNSDNKMLQRIYGTSFPSQQELDEYIGKMEEAKKRDHRKIGREMDLFDIFEEGPGFPFFLPKGMIIRNELEKFWREEHIKRGYEEIKTPIILNEQLWHTSGHWDNYKDNMYFTTIDDENYAVKPMNCPGHVEIFKQGIKSYRDLPLRIAEFGSCTRNEPSGSLHGIMRVRGFVQDDAHIFCTEEQISSEVCKFCNLLKSLYRDFGFDDKAILVKFSTRPEKRVGDDATWDRAENALAEACKAAGLEYEIAPGEGAFYGPKLEFTLVDALGREWQCGTIQADYQLPSKERLNAEYIGEDNQKHQPVMLHRAALGSLERFIGILIEQFGGALPPWLSPVQAMVIPVAPVFNEYAESIAASLSKAGFRVKADIDTDRMNAKIRKYQEQKIPYQLVVGEKEKQNNSVTVRLLKGAQKTMSVDEFTAFLKLKTDTVATSAEF